MRNYEPLLEQAIKESNAIEGYEHVGLFKINSQIAARMCMVAAQEKEMIHPRILHAVVMDRLELPLGHQPGDYRTCGVTVGSWTPPSPEKVEDFMKFWWEIADDWADDDPWATHAQFEGIHPFPDGNGRVGRLVYWNRQMIQGVDLDIILADERQAYYEKLEAYRQEFWIDD